MISEPGRDYIAAVDQHKISTTTWEEEMICILEGDDGNCKLGFSDLRFLDLCEEIENGRDHIS